MRPTRPTTFFVAGLQNALWVHLLYICHDRTLHFSLHLSSNSFILPVLRSLPLLAALHYCRLSRPVVVRRPWLPEGALGVWVLPFRYCSRAHLVVLPRVQLPGATLPGATWSILIFCAVLPACSPNCFLQQPKQCQKQNLMQHFKSLPISLVRLSMQTRLLIRNLCLDENKDGMIDKHEIYGVGKLDLLAVNIDDMFEMGFERSWPVSNSQLTCSPMIAA